MKLRHASTLAIAAAAALVVTAVGLSAQADPHTQVRTNFEGWATDLIGFHQGSGVDDEAHPYDEPLNITGSVDPRDAAGALGPGIYATWDMGTGGSGTTGFKSGIGDGPGDDFAVFGSTKGAGGSGIIPKLAFVSVSSDGVHFFTFPTSYTGPDKAIPVGGSGAPGWYSGFAGIVTSPDGDGFDLADLPNNAFLDKHSVTQVRVSDVVVSDTDSAGRLIRDTGDDTTSAGFDLRGIGVLNAKIVSGAPVSKCGKKSVLVIVDYRGSGSDKVRIACTHGVAGDYKAVLKSAGFASLGSGMPSQIGGLPKSPNAHVAWISWENLATSGSWTRDRSWKVTAGHVIAFSFNTNVPIDDPEVQDDPNNDHTTWYVDAQPYFSPKAANKVASTKKAVTYVIGAIRQ